MFVGITVLALHIKAHAQPSGNPSVISQIAAVRVRRPARSCSTSTRPPPPASSSSPPTPRSTASRCCPRSSPQHRYLPRQLHNRGDKLVFSNGIMLLGGFAIALIVGFDANIDKLIQLYIIGVFTSFTLSQAGMVRHWNRTIPTQPTRAPAADADLPRSSTSLGAVCTAVVLVIVLYTKVAHGAWIAILAMIAAVRDDEGASVGTTTRSPPNSTSPKPPEPVLPSRNHAIVLVSRLHLPTLRAIAYAKATRPSTLEAVTIQIDDDDTAPAAGAMERARDRHPARCPRLALPRDHPTRCSTTSADVRRHSPRDVVTVFIPEYVVGRWWEQLLHNQSALRLKARLLFEPGVMVTSVPWQLRSTRHLDQPTPITTTRTPASTDEAEQPRAS